MADETTSAKRGRPSSFTEELGLLICGELAAGRSLRAICDQDEGMPTKTTVFRWLAADPVFRDQYARAREAQTDAMMEELFEIADQFDNLSDKLDVEHIQRAKLRIDTRKWAMSKLAPKKYGDRVTSVLEGGDKPVEISTSGPSPRELAKAMALVLAKGLKTVEDNDK